MMDILGIINKIKTKCNEYGMRFKCEDIPGSNAKKLGLEYNGGRFDVQISDNKIDVVSVDWSSVENQKIAKDLISMTQRPVDNLPADADKGYIALSECGKDSLFGGICVAAVWIHPDLSHRNTWRLEFHRKNHYIILVLISYYSRMVIIELARHICLVYLG